VRPAWYAAVRPRADAERVPLAYGDPVHAQRPTWWAGVRPTLVLPLVVGVVTLVGTNFAALRIQDDRPLDALGYALLAIGPIALVFRRWRPPAVLGIAAGAVTVYLGLGYAFGPVFLPTLVALASAVGVGRRLATYTVVGVTFLVLLIMHVVRRGADPSLVLPATAWLCVVAAVIGAAEAGRARRERLTQARAALAEAERRRGSEERLRIAQELHDVLGHHVSLINVQAGVALYLMDDDPEQARSALTAIKQSSRDLLKEMRSTLGVLRAVDEPPPHHPVPGLAQLDALVADTEAAGLPVELETRGAKRDLPPSVDLAAYRIVQEALTNTRRHAGPARAHILLDFDESGLTVQVDDDGRGAAAAPPDGGGNGLPGMRERATALGGTITTGPRDGGGYRVRATLPAAVEPS
jgi:signal transduction histidine kinase